MNKHTSSLDEYVEKLAKGELSLEELDEILKSGNLATVIRRKFLERKFNIVLSALASTIIDFDELSKINIKNTIGAIQIPLSIIGPFMVKGTKIKGELYIPLATLNKDVISNAKRGLEILSLSRVIETKVLDNSLIASITMHVNNNSLVKLANWVRDHIYKYVKSLNLRSNLSKILTHIDRDLVKINLVFEVDSELNESAFIEIIKGLCNDLKIRSPYKILSISLKSILYNMSVIARATIRAQRFKDYIDKIFTQFNEDDVESLTALLVAIGQNVANTLYVTKYLWFSPRDKELEVSLLLSNLRLEITNKIPQLPTQLEVLRVLDIINNYFLDYFKLAEIIAVLLLAENIGSIIA